MQYIVSGYIGFDNFGDEAIAKTLVQKLKKENAEKITLISSNPKKTSELYGTDSCGMLNFLPSLLKSDVLVSGGGSLLQDTTSIKSLLYYLCVIFSALILGKKVEIFAQGIGPIKSGFGQTLTRFALKKADKISVRDKNSQELLNSWGIESVLVHDPILDIDLPQQNTKDGVGIQLRTFKGVDKIFLKKLSFEINKRFGDKKIELLSLHDSYDLDVCKEFAELLKNEGAQNVTVFGRMNVNEVIERISNLEYLIAMRFHANVIGIKSGVKTLAINYDPKVQSLAEEYHLSLINLDDEDFSEKFEKLL